MSAISSNRTTLGSIAEFINGGAWKQTEYANEGVPVVRVTDIKNETVDLSACKFLPKSSFEKYAKHALRIGDLVICTVGSHPTQPGSVVGRAAVMPGSVQGALLNQNAVCIRSSLPYVDQRWLCYLGRSQAFHDYIISCARGSANQVRMAIGLLKEMPVVLPPLPVQQRIAGILLAYDELIENSQRRIKILESMARALYRDWFVQFRYPGHENHPRVDSPLGKIPQGWEMERLCDLFDFVGGSQPPKIEHIHEERPGYVRFIQNRDYGSSSHLTYVADSRRNKICERLDIMVDKYGEPGKSRFGLAGAYNVALAKLLPHEPDLREWLRGFVSEPDFKTYLAGASMAATRASLNSSHFTVDVVVPPTHIAGAFRENVETMLKSVLTHKDAIANLRRTRELLLPRLLSGQIEVEAA